MIASLSRCSWAGDHPAMIDYHDREWGVPVRDDRLLFELLTLEGAQAGLSWRTVLLKRDGYRKAFLNFDLARVAAFDEQDRARLLADPGIVRNRAKVASAIGNAGHFLAVQREYGTFARYLWGFVDDRPVCSRFEAQAEVPASAPLSDALSRDLHRRGFRFVGTTIVYAFLQASGVVNDHLVSCFRHQRGQDRRTTRV